MTEYGQQECESDTSGDCPKMTTSPTHQLELSRILVAADVSLGDHHYKCPPRFSSSS
jgi:hypothetical protein